MCILSFFSSTWKVCFHYNISHPNNSPHFSPIYEVRAFLWRIPSIQYVNVSYSLVCLYGIWYHMGPFSRQYARYLALSWGILLLIKILRRSWGSHTCTDNMCNKKKRPITKIGHGILSCIVIKYHLSLIWGLPRNIIISIHRNICHFPPLFVPIFHKGATKLKWCICVCMKISESYPIPEPQQLINRKLQTKKIQKE